MAAASTLIAGCHTWISFVTHSAPPLASLSRLGAWQLPEAQVLACADVADELFVE
jgi:hypothetical protein